MNTLDALRAARALIATPESWTKNALARDSAGNDRALRDPEACAFCAMGAVLRVLADEYENHRTLAAVQIEHAVMHALSREIQLSFLAPTNHSRVAAYNDGSTHAEVLALFDRAIASEGARAGEAG